MKIMTYSRFRQLILIIGLSYCEQMMAQESVISLVKKVGTMLDSMAVKGLDQRYIEAPKKPWQIIARGNVSQTVVSMETHGDIIETGHRYSANPYFKTQPSQYVGLWAGYRGYGFGYTFNVGGDKGSTFTIGATGGAYGVNIRIHRFENSHPNLNLESELISQGDKDEWHEVQLYDPIRVNTFMADAYYMFNGKKFSYAAAYDQSVIQKRSAGSFMAGLMYNYTNIDYADDVNGDLIYLMQDIGRLKLWQGSVGAGYAYNWVPCRGLLVNVMAMPMITLINKVKLYSYRTNVDDLLADPTCWDPNLTDDEWDEWFYGNLEISPKGSESFNSGISIGIDARVSLTYNFGNFFINAFGQFNNIRFRQDDTHGHLNDWFVNSSFGIRL